MLSRQIIVGDVHGCLDELRRLFDELALAPGDRVIMVGDLVNKGPDSGGVFRYLQEASRLGLDLVVIRGNHDDKVLRFAKHAKRHWEEGTPNPMDDRGGKLARLLAELDASDLEFLANSVLYARFPLEFGQAVVIHGGVEPSIKDLPPEAAWELLSASKKRPYMSLMRTRWVNAEGSAVRLADVTDDDVFWASRYDGRFGHVYFGHVAFMKDSPARFAHATGIDLGAVYGGYLAAVTLTPDEAPRTTVVRARRVYAQIREGRRIDVELVVNQKKFWRICEFRVAGTAWSAN